MHYVLSFERSTHIEKKLIPENHILSPDGRRSVLLKGFNVQPDVDIDRPRDILRIKKAVFDSTDVVGFILPVNEMFYLTNKKTREVIGDVMGGAEGCDGLSLRGRLGIWDENFTRRLEADSMFSLWRTTEYSSAINQTIAIKTIHKLGFPVTAMWNGREALSYLLSPSPSRPSPNIILMDFQMPVMDGYEATKILRTKKEYAEVTDRNGKEGKMLKDIPVIAMTASAIQGDREKCHDAGMDDYLAKPVEKADLEEMLVKWAGRKRL